MQEKTLAKPGQEWDRLLQRVKTNLLSRKSEEQKEALAWLTNQLNVNSTVASDAFVPTLLKSEIIALLCETTMMTRGELVLSTLECLASLTTSEQFYRQTHASYVVASILRAGHFVTLESNATDQRLVTLESIARALDKIFEGASDFRVPPNELCRVGQIFELLKKLLTPECRTCRTVFSAAKIISFVLPSCAKDDERVGDRLGDEELVFGVLRIALKLTLGILESREPAHGRFAFRAMVMICGISAAAIPLCSQPGYPDANGIGSSLRSAEIDRPHRADLADCIYSTMLTAVIPNFNKIDQDERNGRFYAWFAASLNGLYKICDRGRLRDLSNRLAEQGFLQTLPRLTTLPTRKLRDETLSLLARILTSLASVSLSIETWLGGEKQFQKFLSNALESLPLDPSTWLSFLGQGDARSDALVVLFHYNFLAESTGNAAVYLPAIVAYSLSSTSLKAKRKPTAILKALWFTLSFAAVSHEDPSAVESYEAAIARLFNDLESADVRRCFTHHPAIVIHCLQSVSHASERLRGSVVCLWLENGGDAECVADASARGHFANNYCLLEMVRTGSPEAVDAAMKAMYRLVTYPEAAEGLGNATWEILQRTLARGYVRDDYNAASILKLAALLEPREISGTLLVRSLYCLASFIVENASESTLVSLGIRNAHCLLSLSVRRNDPRGVAMFTGKPELLKVLKTLAFANEDAGLSYLCFDCLSILVQCQGSCPVQCVDTLEIEAGELLEQLYVDDCSGVLQLVRDILFADTERPLVTVTNDLFSGRGHDVATKALYLQLHAVHSKSGPKDRSLCRVVLAGILNRCGAANDLGTLKILGEMDWTYVLIRATVGEKRTLDPDFVDFASVWLYHRYLVSPKRSPRGHRSCGGDQFENILDVLGRAALNNFGDRPGDEPLRRLVENLLLFRERLSGDVAADLEQAGGRLAEDRGDLAIVSNRPCNAFAMN